MHDVDRDYKNVNNLSFAGILYCEIGIDLIEKLEFCGKWLQHIKTVDGNTTLHIAQDR